MKRREIWCPCFVSTWTPSHRFPSMPKYNHETFLAVPLLSDRLFSRNLGVIVLSAESTDLFGKAGESSIEGYPYASLPGPPRVGAAFMLPQRRQVSDLPNGGEASPLARPCSTMRLELGATSMFALPDGRPRRWSGEQV